MTTAAPIPPEKRTSRRIAALATAFVLGLLIILAVVIYPQIRLPNVPEPFDVEAFRHTAVPPDDNAFELYRQAMAAFHPLPPEQQAPYDAALKSGWAVATPELRQWLAQNGETLELYRQGSARPDALADPPGTPVADLAPATQDLRALARLARLEAARLEEEGNRAGAAELYGVILRSSRHAGRRGPAVQRLIGVALHTLAADSLAHWSAAPEVDAELLRTALADVRAIDRLTVPLSQPLQGEYLSAQSSIDALPPMVFAQKRTTRLALRLAFENWLSQCDRPRPARMPMLPGESGLFEADPAAPAPRMSAAEIEAWSARAPLAKLLLPTIRQLILAHDRERALQALLELDLALQLYAREHGAFPDTLAPLSGTPLGEIPADPFGRGEPIRYRRAPDGSAMLWSIGPDEVDDDARINLFAAPGTKGDLVLPLAPPAQIPP
jgi:hypothetical protein